MSSSKVFAERTAAMSEPPGTLPKFLESSWKYELEEARASDFAWSESDRYLENLRLTLPKLKRLYMTGGEPTLIKSNKQILRELLAMGRKDCLVSLTTNLSVDNTELLDIASGFDRIEITGSLDGFGDLNSYIRYPSEWKIVEKNLDLILSKPKKFSFAIMSVIQVLNLYGFPDFIEWLSHNPRLRDVNLISTIIQHPAYLRPECAPAEMRQVAVEKYERLLASKDVNEGIKRTIGEIVKYISPSIPTVAENQNQLRDFIRFNDRVRKTSLTAVFPELADFLMRPLEQTL